MCVCLSVFVSVLYSSIYSPLPCTQYTHTLEKKGLKKEKQKPWRSSSSSYNTLFACAGSLSLFFSFILILLVSPFFPFVHNRTSLFLSQVYNIKGFFFLSFSLSINNSNYCCVMYSIHPTILSLFLFLSLFFVLFVDWMFYSILCGPRFLIIRFSPSTTSTIYYSY